MLRRLCAKLWGGEYVPVCMYIQQSHSMSSFRLTSDVIWTALRILCAVIEGVEFMECMEVASLECARKHFHGHGARTIRHHCEIEFECVDPCER